MRRYALGIGPPGAVFVDGALVERADQDQLREPLAGVTATVALMLRLDHPGLMHYT